MVARCPDPGSQEPWVLVTVLPASLSYMGQVSSSPQVPVSLSINLGFYGWLLHPQHDQPEDGAGI